MVQLIQSDWSNKAYPKCACYWPTEVILIYKIIKSFFTAEKTELEIAVIWIQISLSSEVALCGHILGWIAKKKCANPTCSHLHLVWSCPGNASLHLAIPVITVSYWYLWRHSVQSDVRSFAFQVLCQSIVHSQIELSSLHFKSLSRLNFFQMFKPLQGFELQGKFKSNLNY